VGRHRRVAGGEEVRQVQLLASAGLTQEEISQRLGITARAFRARLKNSTLLKNAYDAGVRNAKKEEARDGGKRMPWRRDSINVDVVRRMASEGASLTAIAAALKSSSKTIKRRLQEEPELARAHAKGVADLVNGALTALAARAREGDPAAVRLLLERLQDNRQDEQFLSLFRRQGAI
jgi:hypothetical protein